MKIGFRQRRANTMTPLRASDRNSSIIGFLPASSPKMAKKMVPRWIMVSPGFSGGSYTKIVMNDITKLRAWWSHRQGLDQRLVGKDASHILSQTGWARSVGGCNPYISLFARGAISREAVDSCMVRHEILELPSARGCTYVLPAEDYALGLAAGEGFREAEMRVALRLGVTHLEIEALCTAIIDALAAGPMSPEEIRSATGQASRSLGEEGKKKGVGTSLPLALGKLQAIGEIHRIPAGGRLDQQRYKYGLWRPNPRDNFALSIDEVRVELARRFFKWIVPATQGEFQWFSGLGVGAAKDAVAPLNLVPIEPESSRLIDAEDLDTFMMFQVSKTPQYSLVSSIDGISLLRRDHKSLADLNDQERSVFSSQGMANLGRLADLPSNAVLDRGRLVGLWEYDTNTNTIAWYSFVPRNAEVTEAVLTMEGYIRDQLGDARSFSLDSPKSREPLVNSILMAASEEP